MRRWQGVALVVAAILASAYPSSVLAAGRPPGKDPSRTKWEHKTVGRSGFRFNRGRPGTSVQYKVVRHCTTWTVMVDVPGPLDADGKPTTVQVPQKWRRCAGYNAGTGVGQPFQVADSTPDGEEVSEVFAPAPVLSFDSRTPQPLAYTQRAVYWWLDPATQSTVTAPVEVVENGRRTGRVIGSATLTPVKLIFDPGIEGSGAQECEGSDITRAYDPGEAHNVQSTTCWHVYYVSSRNQPGQRYQAFARVEWRVLNVTIEGRPQDGPFENRESVSPIIPVEVREIQVIPTCRGASPEECQFR